MYRRLLAAALIAACVAVALTVSHPKRAAADAVSAEPAETAPTQAQISADAYQAAERSGDPNPTSIEEVSGTLGGAAHALDPNDAAPSGTDPRTGGPWADGAVEVVTMRGHFTLNAPTPKKAAAPKGTVLTVLIDGRSNQLVGVALNNTTPDLHEVGANVTTIGG